jgi:hypothetical protein
MDGIMQSLAGKKLKWKKDMFFTMKLARQKLSKNYAEVTPSTGMLLIVANIINPFR